MKRPLLDAILAARREKQPVALVTWTDSGRQALLSVNAGVLAGDGEDIGPAVVEGAAAALRRDKSHALDTPSGPAFMQAINPPLRMIIIGAVHISQALAPMAAMLGYEVSVVDPRRAFASSARFPEINVLGNWPDDALAQLKPDRRSAVVTLTHDPKLDDPALTVALRSEAFYIASLGSKRTHAKRVERLRRAGFDDADIARIHGPAGLAIHARSPAEIATAILAQATQVLRGADSG
jgi:xanthine dehydrogenase accessory factor